MIDRVFGGRYRLIERIGIGGMAEVYRATDEVLGRTVAVKLMLPQYAADPTFAARFKQEAQAAANLQSPYIVNIYDWGRDDVDETFYIVMELVRGTDLKSAINQRGALNQRKAAEVASQVCAALSVAHGYGIIHRDIKPHNVMVQPDGNAKVMDFGIARANGSAMTQTGSVLGTAYYVSPEQAQGKELTAATDLYSLGITLYESVTGKLPFEGPDAVTVALKQVNQEPVPPSEVNPDIDPDLEAIILKAMAKNPEERFTSAATMRTALNNYLSGLPVDIGTDGDAQTTVISTAGSSRRAVNRGENRTEVLVGARGGTSGAGRAGAGGAGAADGDGAIARTTVMPAAASGVSGTAAMNVAHEEQRERDKRPAVIIGIVLGVLALALLIFLLFKMNAGNSTDSVKVPNVVNMTISDAEKRLDSYDLKVGDVTYEASETVEKGRIISSDPPSRTIVDRGTRVNLVVSSGSDAPVQKQVPLVVDLSQDEAKKRIEDAGFRYSHEGEEYHDTIEAGRVCRQEPAANGLADEGTTVRVWVSKGREVVEVPKIVGETYSEAERILFNRGFVLGEVRREYSSTVPKDQVISQNPGSYSSQPKGTSINLVVSDGPDPATEQPPQPPPVTRVTVPNIVGRTPEAATAAVSATGLVAVIEYADASDPDGVGKVVGCTPGEGTEVDKGSTVIITVGKAPDGGGTPPSP